MSAYAADLKSIKLKLASPEEILSWSHGEVTKPETINYRIQRAEKDGLFCEKIFGPEKDYECYCGKYKRIRYKGIVCDRCGVEVTRSSVRRERMGHIKLAAPVSHIWFLRGVPSRIGLVLDKPMAQVEKVIYFAAYIIKKVDEDGKKRVLGEIEKEFKSKIKTQKSKTKELKEARDAAVNEVRSLEKYRIVSEPEYRNLSLKYGEIFEAGTGAECLRKLFEEIKLEELMKQLVGEEVQASPVGRQKVLRRLRFVKSLIKSGVRPEWMLLTVLPVIPPELRPMVQLDGGRYATADLNDLYRRVINRNNRLKYLLEINAPEVIVRNEKRMLQEAVDSLIDNSARKGQTVTATTGGKRLLKSLADVLKGKQGRFRQNLLGKRVDYSGRSVIVIGPELKLDQCGLPKKMALELFRPFVAERLITKELAYNIRSANKLIDEKTDDVWKSLEEVIEKKYVLLNRAPTLHRLGIQAFKPILIEGNAIQIHPLVCEAFNADFDGDQMAVHIPLSKEAQMEAANLMLSSKNLLKPSTGEPIVNPTQDIILGCYWLTKMKEGAMGEGQIFGNEGDALLAYEFGRIDLGAKIKVKKSVSKKVSKPESQKPDFIQTSVGRIIFNMVLPDDFPFINENLNKKILRRITAELIKKYDEASVPILDKIKELGFEYSTLSAITWGVDDLKVPEEKKKIIESAEKEVEKIQDYYMKGFLSWQERRAKIIEVWQGVKTQIASLVPKTLGKESTVFTIADSGARGTWDQPVQMAGMKGLVVNPAGQIIELPVKSSFKEGFNVLEYFISTHGARKGTSDTALRTASAGYLTRRLVDVAQEIIIHEDDCADSEGITVFRQDTSESWQGFDEKVFGRVLADDITIQDSLKKKGKVFAKKGTLIDFDLAGQIKENLSVQEIKIRSPLSCKTRFGICGKCYGYDLGNNKLVERGTAVGVIAAQAIGEPGTQLTMRTFHTGGVAGGGDITRGLPRVEEIFEARPPKGKALISEVSGQVEEIREEGNEKNIRIKVEKSSEVPKLNKSDKKKTEYKEYRVFAGTGILVKSGQVIESGQQLTEGNVDLRELFRYSSKAAVQRYIIQEIQKIYTSEGVSINDRHIEVIVRQMFSRVRIKDSGDGSFAAGEIVERDRFLEQNDNLRKNRKTRAIAQPLILGISKVSLTTESFLSAASFQETSRVLIKAAIEGKKDMLRGFKENVIVGRLIPGGTGYRK